MLAIGTISVTLVGSMTITGGLTHRPPETVMMPDLSITKAAACVSFALL
jgi:hypothetical protein